MSSSPATIHDFSEAAQRRRDGGPPAGGDESPLVRGFEFTDKGNGERFATQHGGYVRYVADWAKWLIFDGQRWKVDNTGEVMRLAKLTCEGIPNEMRPAEARVIQCEGTVKCVCWLCRARRHYMRTQDLKGLNAMLSLARSEPQIAATAEQFDADPWLLNVANGTINLKTLFIEGEESFYPARREDLITKLAPWNYDPKAECPTWLASLDLFQQKNQEMIDFLARAVGYSMTAVVDSRALFILYGPSGKNGKTTFVETIQRLLGDYARTMPVETLLAKNQSSIPNDVAALRGARFVSAAETDESNLGMAKLKRLLGGDTVSARFMRGEFFEFRPTHHLWVSTNHKPNIRETAESFWEDLKLIPFSVFIPPEARIARQDLEAALDREMPGILNWCLMGLRDWRDDGQANWRETLNDKKPFSVGTTVEIQQAVAEYRRENDLLGQFYADECEVAAGLECTKRELFDRLKGWVERNNVTELKKLSIKRLGQLMTERGFQTRHTKTGDYWKGIALSSTTTASPLPRVVEENLRKSKEAAESGELKF